MYLKRNRRLKDGKEHVYWNIVESKRCAGGKIVQPRIEQTEDRRQEIQHSDLPEPKCPSMQDAPIQPPGNYAGAVELQKFLNAETRLFCYSGELIHCVATVMSQHFVEGAVESRAAGHKDDGSSSIRQSASNAAQRAQIIPDGLD